VATFLGATVIASIYGEEAYRRTPTPVRAGAAVFMSLTLIATSFGAPATVAAADPAEAVIAAAREYVGANYRLGSEGPRTFDCSGLIYRAFADAGELPRVGGMRLRARGYMQYFVSRGRFTRNEAEARPGDLVVYAMGEHIGIYVGDGKVLSALVQPWGVSVHKMKSINLKVSYILQVNWGGGDGGNGGGGDNAGGNGDGNNGGGDNGRPGGTDNIGRPGAEGNDTDSQPDSSTNGNGGNNAGGGDQPNTNNGAPARPDRRNAVAVGTMNLRSAADPNARIIGWIGRNGAFKIVGTGKSPAGYDWFQVETRSGKTGWVYARWVRPL